MDATFPTLLAESIPGGWRPGIGDPSIGGWATVVAYFAAAIACGRAAWAEGRMGQHGRAAHPIFWRPGADRPDPTSRTVTAGRRALFWWTIAAAMVLLGINKQLDLQSLLLVSGRRLARAEGWYDDRQVVQRAFIYGVAAAGLGLLVLMAFLFRSEVLRRPLAPIGMVFLLVFVLVRASSFHHVDLLLGSRVLGTNVNRLLEVGGIACVFASSVRRSLEDRRSAGASEARRT